MKNFLPILLLALSWVSCRTDYVSGQLDEAERMMDENHPDSALTLLSSLRKESVRGRDVQARLALATAMALDKCYIDTADLLCFSRHLNTIAVVPIAESGF